ncbi:MAG: hypothetical protein M1830_005840 [Pleopsidium flavum]|nr:MAG: hypothetical protein M1830_005840 [Pleopsidium flavum]
MDEKQRNELLDGNLGDLVDISSRAPVGPSNCTGFVNNPPAANTPSNFDGAWVTAASLLLAGYVQGFALDGWRELAERYPARFEGPTTWMKRFGLVSVLTMGFVLVWKRFEGRRRG